MCKNIIVKMNARKIEYQFGEYFSVKLFNLNVFVEFVFKRFSCVRVVIIIESLTMQSNDGQHISITEYEKYK